MTKQDTMRAVILTGHGGLDKLEYRTDLPKPVIKDNEALIKIGACGLNNTDINTRTAWYSSSVTGATTGGELVDADSADAAWGGKPLTFPRIQGADVVGVVTEVGANADAALLGKRVMIETWLWDAADPDNPDKTGYFGSECDGGYAEFTKVDSSYLHPVDSDWSDRELATFATSYVTAENMLNRAAVGAGDVVLITGASGGVGSALIQLAKRRNARTIALVSEDKADAVRAVGADVVLPRAPADLAGALRAATGEDGVTVVADVVGGASWSQFIGVLKRGGRYTCAGAIAGPIVEFDLRVFYLRDLTFTGATIVPRGVFADLVGYIERKEIRPLLAAAYPLEQIREAQQAFIAKQHVGNIVVYPG